MSDRVTAEAEGAQELASILANAFRHGRDSGAGRIGTSYVLVALARHMPSLGHELSPLRERIRHGLRAGGREPALSSSTPAQDFEALALLREGAQDGVKGAGRRTAVTPPVWSEGVRGAVGEALHLAQRNGVRHAHGMHLVVAILGNPDYDACRLLRSLDIEAADLLRRLPVTKSVGEDGTPIAFVPNILSVLGVLDGGRRPVLRRLRLRVGRRLLRLPRTGVFLPFVEQEAIRQAVRVGSSQVTEVHLLVALAALEHQLLATGKRFGELWADYNGAGALLQERGVEYRSVAVRAALLQGSPPSTDRGRRWRSLPSDPVFGSDAAEAVERAEQLAREQGHRYTGTSHLLVAMLADEEGTVSRLLKNFGVDTAEMKAMMTHRMGLER